MKSFSVFILFFAGQFLISCAQQTTKKDDMKNFEVQKTDEEWRKTLTDEQYQVLRQKGTERPFSGQYYYLDDDGVYKCAACQNPLFKADTKFDAGCGWPSFYEPISDKSVIEHPDYSHGMVRTEVVCAKCGSHLGHVFNDAPDQPTGLRYCINSVSLDFEKK
jgi:peptide-methionine (R)-S-oxide reductase